VSSGHETKSAPLIHPHIQRRLRHLLLGLEVVQEDRSLLRLLTPVLNNDARAVDDLASVTLTVENAETGPLAELLAVGDLDERNVVLVAESDNKLLVGLLLAVLVQDTHVSLATVKSLGSLTETTGKTIVHERELQDTLESIENGHLALGGIAGNLNNIGDLGGVVFYVRHLEYFFLVGRSSKISMCIKEKLEGGVKS
jgi:hypothetical protein